MLGCGSEECLDCKACLCSQVLQINPSSSGPCGGLGLNVHVSAPGTRDPDLLCWSHMYLNFTDRTTKGLSLSSVATLALLRLYS